MSCASADSTLHSDERQTDWWIVDKFYYGWREKKKQLSKQQTNIIMEIITKARDLW